MKILALLIGAISSQLLDCDTGNAKKSSSENQPIFPVSYGQKAYEMIMTLDLETVPIGIKIKAMLQRIATEESLFNMN